MRADSSADHDAVVRYHVYDIAMASGSPPTFRDLGTATGLAEAEIRASLGRLAAARILVLQRESGEVLMAAPFSAVPTAFLVETARYRAFANCVWDAIGVPAMLHEAAVIRTGCGCCGERMELEVGWDGLASSTGVVHFAVPAARWWEDIVFT